ncbi:MAG: MotA/TolQ/ExbB proton channel family protein [Burkholderiales bacterium]|jgi:biopolymer transport protein ExbB|nr:MotA/TolQ/ExbB proton channel family protein [Burkholderiales bacterium]
MTDMETLGFGHFIAQSDAVGKAVLVILIVMSLISWLTIFGKGIRALLYKRRIRAFLADFYELASCDEVSKLLKKNGAHCPFSRLAAQALKALYLRQNQSAAHVPHLRDLFTRTIRKSLDEETVWTESGLMLLATIGATAPFVGLFGTVWGVYHALVNIGMAGAGTLDRVAGPVGEALIMTGLGLAVAIPAVIGYNFLTRSNRMMLARLDGFAHDLYAMLTEEILPSEQMIQQRVNIK